MSNERLRERSQINRLHELLADEEPQVCREQEDLGEHQQWRGCE